MSSQIQKSITNLGFVINENNWSDSFVQLLVVNYWNIFKFF